MRLKQDEKQEEDLEALLRRYVRARLPLVRQFLLYLDPFALFKDASRGRERALSYNRDLRWILLHYLRRWSCIAATLFLAIAPTESLAAQSPVFLIPTAAFAVGFCIAITVIACTLAAYLLLGKR
jgi:hypothetical protein